MGAALRRTALSPNIKERRDYSCAIFDGQGRVIAMGDHMPVHLAPCPCRCRPPCCHRFCARRHCHSQRPYAGGTHLPDITMVLPVFLPADVKPAFYVSNRAHHADVGGRFAGSMGPAEEIYQEGIRIPPVRIVRNGQVDREMLDLILLNVRTPREREGDLDAQIGSCRVGERRILEVAEKYGKSGLGAIIEELLDYSERLVRAELRSMPAGEFSAEDWLDDDGVTDEPRKIAVRLRMNPKAGEIHVDFCRLVAAGCGQRECSARHYFVSVLLCAALPAPRGCACDRGILRPLTLATLAGSIVDALPPAAVAGGNVETSQRIVDVLLRALAKAVPGRVPAASAGTMSNMTIGALTRAAASPSHTTKPRQEAWVRVRNGRHLRGADAHDQLSEHASRGA